LPPPTIKAGAATSRTQRVIVGLPGLVEQYRRQIENGLKVLTDPQHVTVAREAFKKLLVEDTIVLHPNEDYTKMREEVAFKSLADLGLELAGTRRRVGAKPRGANGQGESGSSMKSGKRYISRDVPRAIYTHRLAVANGKQLPAARQRR
jgi:hypothetical protein